MTCTQLKATYTSTAVTTVKSVGGRLYSFYCVPGGTAGILEVRNGSIAATVEGQWAVASIGSGFPTDIDVPGGLRCSFGIYVSQPAGCQTTFLYD